VIFIVSSTHHHDGSNVPSPAPSPQAQATTSLDALAVGVPAAAPQASAAPATAPPSSDPASPTQTAAPVTVQIAPANAPTPTPSIAYCDVQLDVSTTTPRWAMLAVRSDTRRLVLQVGDSIGGHTITALDSDGQVVYLNDGHAIHANQEALCEQYSPLQTQQPCPIPTTDSAGIAENSASWRWAPALAKFDGCGSESTPTPDEWAGSAYFSDAGLQGAPPGSARAAELVRHHRLEDAIARHTTVIGALQKQTWVWDN